MCHIRCNGNASEDDSPEFLVSSAAATLSVLDIAEMSEAQAESRFEAIRFARSGGEPSCIWCDCEVAYRITRNVKNRKTGVISQRRLFKCQKCLKQFSVTSGTEFHGRKLTFKKIMLATLLFTNGAAGKAALHLRRDLRCNHKTAWLLLHRLRHSMTSYTTSRRLTGDIEMDSTSIGGVIRPFNEAEARKKQPRRNMSKVVNLSVLRERGKGGRVVPFLGDEAALVKVIGNLVDTDARPITDEHKAWNALFAQFPVRQVKHKDRYSDLRGISTNLVESHWSRFKRMYRGTYRHMSRQFAHAYNGECAWREEHIRSNGEQFILMLAGALHHPPSPQLRGYYQRTLRKAV